MTRFFAGITLNGYELIEFLGSGASGSEVWRVRRESEVELQHRAAKIFLLPSERAAGVMAEAQLLASITSQHVIKIH